MTLQEALCIKAVYSLVPSGELYTGMQNIMSEANRLVRLEAEAIVARELKRPG